MSKKVYMYHISNNARVMYDSNIHYKELGNGLFACVKHRLGNPGIASSLDVQDKFDSHDKVSIEQVVDGESIVITNYKFNKERTLEGQF